MKRFKKDCLKFKKLIKEGEIISKKAPSISRGYSEGENEDSEKEGFEWFTKTKNFLSALFGMQSTNLKLFTSCFREYKSISLLGTYKGTFSFVKEDLNKSIGVLKGTYFSFKNKEIKRKNRLVTNLFFKLVKEIAPIIFKKLWG